MFGEQNHVGATRPARGREKPAARAAERGLDLVGDEQGAVFFRELAERLDERRGELAHAAFALDRLDDDRGDVPGREGLS